MNRSPELSFPLVVLLLAACSDASRGPSDPAIPRADVTLGHAAFVQACATCHASGDGFDLRTFSFSDTTIIRRAVKHVDSATARNIVAYIQTVAAPRNNEDLRLFQPKGTPLAGDVEFATALFGRDAWPSDLTTADLAAIDPRTVRVAIKLPIWSDEGTNLDWMPDFPLPAGVLDYNGGLAAGAIAGYRAAPTRENLLRAVNALNNADRASANVSAPCVTGDTLRVKYRECFEVRRWTSTLVALHMLRNGMDTNLGSQLTDVWWDVGNVARQSRADRSAPIANSAENWTSWMYLAWSFDPSRHVSAYNGGGLRQLGLNRHATFVALRSQVARPRNSAEPYADLLNAVRFAPSSWTLPVATFALRNVGERLAQGDRPSLANIAKALESVYGALAEAYKKVPAGNRATLDALAQPVLAGLALQ